MKFKEDLAPVPMLLTLGNLVCGFMAIGWASMGDPSKRLLNLEYAPLKFAAYLILLAMVFDVLDGWVARATKAVSVFGAELDSLADMVSFGVAPALLARQTVLIFTGVTVLSKPTLWVCATIYVACTALRLARYNIETETNSQTHKDFKGLPSPAAAAFVSALVILHLYLGYPPGWFNFKIIKNFYGAVYEARIIVLLLPFSLMATGLLMLSTFRYAHLANRLLGEKKDIAMLPFIIVLVVFGLAFFPLIFPLAVLIYILSGVVNLGLGKFLDYLNAKQRR